MKYLFLLLFGFLFISLAEANRDIEVSDGIEAVIESQDLDLVVINTPIGVFSVDRLVINKSRDFSLAKIHQKECNYRYTI